LPTSAREIVTRAWFVLCCLWTTGALGQTPDPASVVPAPLPPAARDEARRRFDQGIVLYNANDLEGALAEFQRAARLTGHPLVLYNLALVQSQLGHSADVVATLERLNARGGSELGPEQVARARALYQTESARVGTIVVTSSPANALVQLDGIDTVRTPTGPLRVTAGSHFVAVSAPGHEPKHLKVSVAGGASELLEVELLAIEDALGELHVAGQLPGVEVLVDGILLGATPLHGSLVLKAGSHDVLFRRDGYAPVTRQLTLAPGGRASLSADLAPRAPGSGGLLRLTISETGALVTIDGRPRLDYAAGVGLPVGPHLLRIERSGFLPLERQIVVGKAEVVVVARLLPTPPYLAEYLGRASRQRLWSYLAMSAGALTAAGGGAFLLWNQGEKAETKRAFDDYVRGVEAASPSRRCLDEACEQTLGVLAGAVDSKRQRDVYGWVGVGVGAAALTAGALLFVLGDDPNRYEPTPESKALASISLRLRLQSLELRGEF
jgi:PEGA domain